MHVSCCYAVLKRQMLILFYFFGPFSMSVCHFTWLIYKAVSVEEVVLKGSGSGAE